MALLEIEYESKLMTGRKMCSVLVLLNVLGNIVGERLNVSDKLISILSILFSMLLLKPVNKEDIPRDLSIVLQLIKPKYHQQLAATLAKFAQYLYEHHKKSPEWIYVIPFIHKFQHKEMQSSFEEAGKYVWKDIINFQVCDSLTEFGLKDMRYEFWRI